MVKDKKSVKEEVERMNQLAHEDAAQRLGNITDEMADVLGNFDHFKSE